MHSKTVDFNQDPTNIPESKLWISPSKKIRKTSYLATMFQYHPQSPTIKVHFVQKINNSTLDSNDCVVTKQDQQNRSVISSTQTNMFQNILNKKQTALNTETSESDCLASNCDQADQKTVRELFTDSSIQKLILYAIFVNYSNLKHGGSRENDKGCDSRFSFASQMVKIVKSNMVNAAHNLKSNCPKKYYTKIRYLFEELTKCIQSRQKKKQEFIKIIIEQFDVGYIQQVFRQMQKGVSLIKKQECDSKPNVQFKNHLFNGLSNVLIFLNIKMTLKTKTETVYLGKAQGNLDLMVRERQNGLFSLGEIKRLNKNVGQAVSKMRHIM